MNAIFRTSRYLPLLGLLLLTVSFFAARPPAAFGSDPAAGTLTAPAESGEVSVTWTGGPYTVATPDPALCASSAVNCDEFILYDDLVREKAKKQGRRKKAPAKAAAGKSSKTA